MNMYFLVLHQHYSTIQLPIILHQDSLIACKYVLSKLPFMIYTIQVSIKFSNYRYWEFEYRQLPKKYYND